MSSSLGNTLSRYGIDHFELVLRLVAIWTLITFGLIMLAITGATQWWGWSSGVGLVAAVWGTIVIVNRLHKNPSFEVYERGVSYTARGQTRSWRWHEFETYTGILIPQIQLGGFILLGSGRYTFTAAGVRAFTVTLSISNAQELVDLLMANITKALLPQAIADFDAGKAVRIGKGVVIDRERAQIWYHTLSMRDVGRANLDLLHLGRARGEVHSLVIYDRQGNTKKRISYRDLPNHYLIVALLNHAAARSKEA